MLFSVQVFIRSLSTCALTGFLISRMYTVFRTPRAYVHPQMTRGRVRGSTTDLQNIGADDHLTTWARRKQYDSNLRKVRTAEIVRRSQSFQTNNAKPPTEQRLSRDRPSSYHNKARYVRGSVF